MKGKIKRDASVGHDFGFFKWPDCRNQVDDPDMIFNITWHERSDGSGWWDCKADGFGFFKEDGGDYGNGSIFANGKDSVELVE